METGLFNRLQATLLAVVTVGLVLLCCVEFPAGEPVPAAR